MSAEEVAKAFTAHYFSTFDSNAAGLAGLFVSLIYPVRSVAGSCSATPRTFISQKLKPNFLTKTPCAFSLFRNYNVPNNNKFSCVF